VRGGRVQEVEGGTEVMEGATEVVEGTTEVMEGATVGKVCMGLGDGLLFSFICLNIGAAGSRLFAASSRVITFVVNKGCFMIESKFILNCSLARSALITAATLLVVAALGTRGMLAGTSDGLRGVAF